MPDGDWLIGWGCATAGYPTHVGAAAARVHSPPTGTAGRIAGHEIGTGAYTMIAQAPRSGSASVPSRRLIGDTRLPPAPVAGGSNSTASACSTVMIVCDQIGNGLFKAPHVGVASPDHGPRRSRLSIVRSTSTRGSASSPIEEYAEFIPTGAPDAVEKPYQGKEQAPRRLQRQEF